MDPRPGGPDWMPITPKTGSLFHAETHEGHCSGRPSASGNCFIRPRQGAALETGRTARGLGPDHRSAPDGVGDGAPTDPRARSGGESAAAELVAKLGSKAEIARELAYRLYTLCERKKRAAEALSYNGLVQSWPEITRLAREERSPQPAQAQLFEAGAVHGDHQPRARRQGDGPAQGGLRPFVEREMKTYHGDTLGFEVKDVLTETRLGWWQGRCDGTSPYCWCSCGTWNDVFRKTLGQAERSLVSELRDVRNAGRTSSHSPATMPTARSTPMRGCSPPSRRRRRTRSRR